MRRRKCSSNWWIDLGAGLEWTGQVRPRGTQLDRLAAHQDAVYIQEMRTEGHRREVERAGQAAAEDGWSVGAFAKAMVTGRKLSIVVMTFATLVLVGCDGAMPGPPKETRPEPAKVFPGTVSATLSDQTDATLDVKDDGTFELVSITQGPSMTTKRMSASAAERSTLSVTSVVVLHGPWSEDGTTATLEITGVVRNGVALTGGELDEYTRCKIAAKIGTDFHENVITLMANCMVTAGDVPIVDERIRVQENGLNPMLSGTWRLSRIRSRTLNLDVDCDALWHGGGATITAVVECPVLEITPGSVRSTWYIPVHSAVHPAPYDYVITANFDFQVEGVHAAITEMTTTGMEACAPDPPPDGPARCLTDPANIYFPLSEYNDTVQQNLPLHYRISDDGQMLTVVDAWVLVAFLPVEVDLTTGAVPQVRANVYYQRE